MAPEYLLAGQRIKIRWLWPQARRALIVSLWSVEIPQANLEDNRIDKPQARKTEEMMDDGNLVNREVVIWMRNRQEESKALKLNACADGWI